MQKIDNYYVGDMYELDPDEVVFRKDYVEFNPPHPVDKYEQVKELITRLGQQRPILMLDGECIDGRHRTKIAKELGRKVLCVNVKSGVDPKALILLVNLDSLGSRSYSNAQKAINAYKLSRDYGYSQKEASILCGTQPKQVSYVKGLIKYGYDFIVKELEKGNKVVIGDMDNGSNSLEYLCKKAKEEYEKDKVVIDTSNRIKFNPDSYIKTEQGKAWYYDKINTLGISSDSGLNSVIRQDYAELANYKFALKEETEKSNNK